MAARATEFTARAGTHTLHVQGWVAGATRMVARAKPNHFLEVRPVARAEYVDFWSHRSLNTFRQECKNSIKRFIRLHKLFLLYVWYGILLFHIFVVKKIVVVILKAWPEYCCFGINNEDRNTNEK